MMPSFKVSPEGNFNPARWALWGGTSLMVFASLTQVALNWRTVARSFMMFNKEERSATQTAAEAVEVPNSWLVIGLIPVTIGLVIVQYFAFHIAIGLGLISVALSLCCASCAAA